jgi:hypothetical protein
MFSQDILLEIDETLNQLILNAEVIQKVDLEDLSETEIDAFQKTQESLLHHLMHMDKRLISKRNSVKKQDKKSNTIQEKLIRFERMRSSYHKNLVTMQKKTSILSKRRTKKFLRT